MNKTNIFHIAKTKILKIYLVFICIFLMGALAFWGVSNFEILKKSVVVPAPNPTILPTPSVNSSPKSTPATQQVDNTQLRKNCIDSLEQERVNIVNQYVQAYQTDEKLKQYSFNSGLDSLENLYKEKKEECYKIYK